MKAIEDEDILSRLSALERAVMKYVENPASLARAIIRSTPDAYEA
jgi:hypothetical protein